MVETNMAPPKAAPQMNEQPYFEERNTAQYDASYAVGVGEDGYVDYGAEYQQETKAVMEMGRPEKILRTGHVELESTNFDEARVSIESLTTSKGGFIEQSQLDNMSTNRVYIATLRVPADKFAELKDAIEEIGLLRASNETTENATGAYYDLETRLNAKRIEEERLLVLIDQLSITKAEDVSARLDLEKQLASVRTDIELYKSQMEDIDALSAYSMLTVNLFEQAGIRIVTDPDDFGFRFMTSVTSSINNTIAFFENVLIFLAGAFIPVLFISAVFVTGFLAYKRLKTLKTHHRKEVGNG
jgi:hypothetical protein